MSAAEEPARFHYPAGLNFILYTLSMGVAVLLWRSTWWPLLGLCWIVQAHLGHTLLLALHEAVHFNLSKNRFLNEFRGRGIGTISLIPLNCYRVLHAWHHSSLATERDMELWPYTDPRTPRILRQMAACAELTLGYFFTPIVFLHGFLVARHADPAVRRLVWIEYGLCVFIWVTILAIVHVMGWWPEFLMAYLVPAIISGNLQSMRKFTEHMGLHGDRPLSATRTVVHGAPVGQALSANMLHVNHHGTHHRFGKIPYYDLPRATPAAFQEDDNGPLFGSYRAAFLDMLPTLRNPRIGKHWLDDANEELLSDNHAADSLEDKPVPGGRLSS
jgi:fatty acid desaturase